MSEIEVGDVVRVKCKREIGDKFQVMLVKEICSYDITCIWVNAESTVTRLHYKPGTLEKVLERIVSE